MNGAHRGSARVALIGLLALGGCLALALGGLALRAGYEGRGGGHNRRLAPVRVRGLPAAAAVATGQSPLSPHSLVAGGDGAVWAWGANEFGRPRAAFGPAAVRVAVRPGGLDPPAWPVQAAGAGRRTAAPGRRRNGGRRAHRGEEGW